MATTQQPQYNLRDDQEQNNNRMLFGLLLAGGVGLAGWYLLKNSGLFGGKASSSTPVSQGSGANPPPGGTSTGSTGSGGSVPTVPSPSTIHYSFTSCPLLQLGSSGTTVQDLQRALAALGFNSMSNIDGVFGPLTQAAVKNLQTHAGISVDGIVGPQTYTALNNALKARGGSWSCGSVPSTSTPTMTTTGGTTYYGGGSNGGGVVNGVIPYPPKYAFSSCPILQYGDSGTAVKAVQYSLAFLKFNSTSNLDGVFGPMTETAVKNFQSANGLTVDGIVGPATYGMINTRLKEYGGYYYCGVTAPTTTMTNGGGAGSTTTTSTSTGGGGAVYINTGA